MIDGAAKGESNQTPFYQQDAAEGLQDVPVFEDTAHGMLFCIGVKARVHFAMSGCPRAFEAPTLLNPLGGEGAKLKIGIGALKTIGVIALGLEFLACEGGEGFAIVDVVGKGGIGGGFETAGK